MQSVDKVDMPVVLQRQGFWSRQRRTLSGGIQVQFCFTETGLAVQTVQKTVDSVVQFWDGRVQFSSADVEETAELPQLQLVELWTKSLTCPLCATTGAVVVDVLCSSSTVGDVPAIMQRRLYSGGASDSVHR